MNLPIDRNELLKIIQALNYLVANMDEWNEAMEEDCKEGDVKPIVTKLQEVFRSL